MYCHKCIDKDWSLRSCRTIVVTFRRSSLHTVSLSPSKGHVPGSLCRTFAPILVQISGCLAVHFELALLLYTFIHIPDNTQPFQTITHDFQLATIWWQGIHIVLDAIEICTCISCNNANMWDLKVGISNMAIFEPWEAMDKWACTTFNKSPRGFLQSTTQPHQSTKMTLERAINTSNWHALLVNSGCHHGKM